MRFLLSSTRSNSGVTMEFHISREAREFYNFDHSLFALSGNVVFVNFHAVREFAQKMNQKRDLVRYPERSVKAGQINAMGLVDEILHYVVQRYREQKQATVMEEALEWLDKRVGAEELDKTLHRFVEAFPPLAVYRQNVEPGEYLDGRTDGVPHRQIVLEEMLLLWLANENPGFSPFIELFDDTELERETSYRETMSELHDFFDTQPHFGPDGQNLIDMLRSPARSSPHSVAGQLEFIRRRWGALLGKYVYRLLTSLDLIAEEEKATFLGPGPSRVYEFEPLELERFSPDQDWMPHVVLLAKNTCVWLHQLSAEYERPITRLDQVPDDELDTLAGRGFTGLWLIGLWERSSASEQIKRMMGNPEAVASAYSIDEYRIADDLGGEDAYANLRDRAWQRGIRLASDMVPNHMGIDSRWVIEHPERFISVDAPPFPSYAFSGPDVCQDERVGIYLEDGYYDRSDAAVVFKRVDHWTGDERYIYHGNDGTRMPWNDTAQLDFLKEEVREAAIQMILHVARKFPIIRFDAAMTLAKKHYQRLWFPEPGTGGAIPSRAEHGMTRQQFDELMPEEFWRRVVDRIAEEVPDTLLLAEAFWLMEGYFVRTLGMHRVYNSAFMNMLRDEDNAKYRSVMKNTLEFDPRIMKRYVNFLNNPDERTAVDQFGKGDKYFGLCTLLATMPGLPMFGHGQVEGYTEKYGMEYRRAYWDESPDPHLIERHEREIFPLLHKRYLFSGVEGFLLYDFFTPGGPVNEDVFAYSNRVSDERALVLYHNRYAETRGWVRNSVAYAGQTEDGEKRSMQRSLGEGLALRDEDGTFTIFRDHVNGLEYIRSNQEIHEKGLYAELGAYQCQVFLGFRQVQDTEWHQYAQLTSYLNGRGVPSIEEALQEVLLQPIHQPFRELVNATTIRRLLEVRRAGIQAQQALTDDVEQMMRNLLRAIRVWIEGAPQPEPLRPCPEGRELQIARSVRRELEAVLKLQTPGRHLGLPEAITTYLRDGGPEQAAVGLGDSAGSWSTLFGWLSTHALGKMADGADFAQVSRSWQDEWLLGRVISRALQDVGLDEGAASWAVTNIKVLTTHQRWFEIDPAQDSRAYSILRSWLRDDEVHRLLQVNRYRDALWFNAEAFEQLLWWMEIVAALSIIADADRPRDQAADEVVACHELLAALRQAKEQSGYRVEQLLEGVRADQ